MLTFLDKIIYNVIEINLVSKYLFVIVICIYIHNININIMVINNRIWRANLAYNVTP